MSKKPDDASRIAGLASILKAGNQPRQAPPSPAPPPEPVPTETLAASSRPKKVKIGKYRDPSYHHYGIYVRKETHKQVKRRLEDEESDQDVSDLIQMLLEQWLKDGEPAR